MFVRAIELGRSGYQQGQTYSNGQNGQNYANGQSYQGGQQGYNVPKRFAGASTASYVLGFAMEEVALLSISKLI